LAAFNTATGDYYDLNYTYSDNKINFSIDSVVTSLEFSLSPIAEGDVLSGSLLADNRITFNVIFERSAKVVGDQNYIYMQRDYDWQWECLWNRYFAEQYTLIKDNINGEAVVAIALQGFKECSNLTNVTLPNTIQRLNDAAFCYCNQLESITLPESLEEICDAAFSGCSSLTSIVFRGTVAQWNAVDKRPTWNFSIPATYVQCSDGRVEL
jgi:hypothetical protein